MTMRRRMEMQVSDVRFSPAILRLLVNDRVCTLEFLTSWPGRSWNSPGIYTVTPHN